MKNRALKRLSNLFIRLSWLLTMISGLWLQLEASESSVADIKIAAERGDAEAQEKLGDAHMARLDGALAELWYRKAAQSGRPSAQAKLGNRLLMRSRMGTGLDSTTREKLGKQALGWIRPAARQGEARAQADLASILYDGKLAPQDLVEAYKWGALAAQNPMHLVERTAGRTVRDASALKMTAEQIAEAERRLAAFKPEAPSQAQGQGAELADRIQLKGITGTQSKRLALINNTTLAEGESAEIKLANRSVVVQCLKITEASVVVVIDGGSEKCELNLKPTD